MNRLLCAFLSVFNVWAAFAQIPSDSLIPHKNISNIIITKGADKPIISIGDSAIGFFYFHYGNTFKESRVQVLITDKNFNKILEKEQPFSGKIDEFLIDEALDCGTSWSFFSMNDDFIREVIVSKQSGEVHTSKLVIPKLLTFHKPFKHHDKLYFLTFDKKEYMLYGLEHGKIPLIGVGKFPETGIKNCHFAPFLEDARYISSSEKPQFDDVAGNISKVYTRQNAVVLTIDYRTNDKQASFMQLAINLETAQAKFSQQPFPSTQSYGRKPSWEAQNMDNYIDVELRNFASFVTTDDKLFLTTISDREMITSISDLRTRQVIKQVVCPRSHELPLKNSDIVNESTGFNYWTGREQKRNKKTISDLDFWDALRAKDISVIAYPRKNGYDLMIGTYVNQKQKARRKIILAGAMFGLIGSAITNANNEAVISYYFYSRLNADFEHQADAKLPNTFDEDAKLFDFNRDYKYRAFFNIGEKAYFTVYDPDSRNVLIFADK